MEVSHATASYFSTHTAHCVYRDIWMDGYSMVLCSIFHTLLHSTAYRKDREALK